MAYDFTTAANSLEEYWMPFTPQRWFKSKPRMVVSADGMYYKDQNGQEILDAAGGLWCVNAGHNRKKIKEAIKAQMEVLDYMSSFQYGHPSAFKAASRLVSAMPEPFTHVFFSNSGSEAVDTALKVALAYQRARGQGQRRVLIGRERAYHGVGFGGMSVGGIPYVRAAFGSLLPDVAHLPHTYDLERNAFSRGMPAHGAELANKLEDLLYMHDPENVAAVIIEPVSGSTGVLPPPKGYLAKIREICDKHGILLIFDEVITGFGRLGDFSSSEYFGVMPDIITSAKGLTNGAVPMGATFFKKEIYDAFMQGPDHTMELMHGYTYSGHPLACAAAIGTLDTFADDNIMENVQNMMGPFEEGLHSLKGRPYIEDIRNCGILGAIQMEKFSDEDEDRITRTAFVELFNRGVMVRLGKNALVLSPPLILDQSHIDRIVNTIGDVLDDISSGKIAA
jgi:beta-alanine--pyruvate transaminase